MLRVLAILLVCVAGLATADARFAESSGFSGKHGTTCVSCHLPDQAPLPPAQVALVGAPAAWDLSASYPLFIRVTGGPPANPVPDTPQGGFDLETDWGTFSAPSNMSGLLRLPSPQEATYTGDGALRRDWVVTWTLPDGPVAPRDATLWVAGLSANGNHVMGGPDTAGERGDRAANISVTVPPSAKVLATWDGQALPVPVLDAYTPPTSPAPSMLTGHVADFADGAEVRIDHADWQPAIGSPSFFLQLPVWTAGRHVIEARAVWNNRTSDVASLSFGSDVAAASAFSTGGGVPSFIGPVVWLLILLAIASPILLKLRKGSS